MNTDTINEHLNHLSTFNLLNFPSTIQSSSNNCAPAAVKSVLFYYGIDETADNLAMEMKTDDEGTTPKEIIACFLNRGLNIKAGKMTQDILEKYIEDKVPVIISLQAWSKNKRSNYSVSYKDGHYVVLVGFDEENFYFNDPSLKTHLGIMNKKEFMKRWHDIDKNGKKYINYGIAIFGKPLFKNKLIDAIR
jgi:ABC-type bacteriocin/lantibiotic exporter with double-glycine peptidase domain